MAVMVAAVALFAALMLPTGASAELAIDAFSADVLDAGGAAETQAGIHPFVATNVIQVAESVENPGTPSASIKDVVVDLPVGFVGDPSDLPTCSRVELTQMACEPSTQVGTLKTSFFLAGATTTYMGPVFNMEVPPGQPAQFGTEVMFGSALIFFDASIRPEDDGITVTSSDTSHLLPVIGTDLEFWGVPADPVHDADRGWAPGGYLPLCNAKGGLPPCKAGVEPKPFLRNLTACGVEPVTRLRINSWEDPNTWVHDTFTGPAAENCDVLDFQPDVKVQPQSTVAGEPSGYTVEVTQALNDSPEALATADLKDAVVTLPEGVTVNPAASSGLDACTEAQMGLGQAGDPACPAHSTIGQVRIETPTLNEPLTGPVYQAAQDQNPFGTTLAIYMAPKSERYGVQLKLAGRVDTEPVTGQLTTTFADNPQLPFSKLTLNLKGGQRAVLVNPPTCGTKQTAWSITSWAQPGTPVTGRDSFAIDRTANGRPCSEAVGFSPGFVAGTADAGAGKHSTFTMAWSRGDSDQEFRSIRQIRLPEGLLGAVGSVPLCAEAQAAAGGCGEESRIGHVQLAVGAGATPLWVPEAGKQPTGVYLTGPYKGAPYGLSILVPAQAGPFDLGTVVVRSALHVDDRTTAITTGIDETRVIDRNGKVTEVLPGDLPRILKGIVLNQRELRVVLDREGFMVNPTDCSPAEISAEVRGYGGGQVNVSDRFRAVDCAQLGFAPRFRARILNKGRKSTLRSFHPRTRFAVVPRKGDANIGAARVVLPSSTLLDQANIGTTCTRTQMAADDCPEASIVGHARAWSPLLQRSVQGPVYLAANGGVRPLPDLAAVMDGEIRVVLQGEISTLRRGGTARLQNTFRVVPDAPVSRFVLTMRGGAKRGLLVNSTDLCRTNERGVAVFRGQNGKRHRLRPRVATRFKGCAKVRHQTAGRSVK